MAARWQRFTRFFVHNWEFKILALMLGAITFYTIRGATSFEVPYSIPLDVRVEKGIAILDQSPRTVDVTFRGSQEDLRSLDQRHIRAVIRPRTTGPLGSETIRIRPADIEGAASVRVVSIRPSVATLRFDREVEKRVSIIKPTTIGEPLVGHIELDYNPRSVNIRGPRRRLMDTHAVAVAPVDVDGRVESFTRQVRVLPPSDAWVAEIEPPEIAVTVNVVVDSEQREFTNLALRALWLPGQPRSADFDPPTVNVIVQGRSEVVETMEETSIQVFVDCTRLESPGTYTLPVKVHLPVQTDVTTRVVPQSASVTLHPPTDEEQQEEGE